MRLASSAPVDTDTSDSTTLSQDVHGLEGEMRRREEDWLKMRTKMVHTKKP